MIISSRAVDIIVDLLRSEKSSYKRQLYLTLKEICDEYIREKKIDPEFKLLGIKPGHLGEISHIL